VVQERAGKTNLLNATHWHFMETDEENVIGAPAYPEHSTS